MQTPTANDLLLAWETALECSPPRRALALLATATAPAAHARMAALPIGVRDERLMRVRQLLFGDTVAALAQCPACGERLDIGFSIDSLCTPAGAPDDEPASYRLQVGGFDIGYRVPTSADLLELPAGDAAAQQAALLRRCVNEVLHDGAAAAAGALPDPVVSALVDAMALADPHATVELPLDCPGCGHGWRSLFDIASFLWREVDAWARRTLHDVHTLACAYGWSEEQILALTSRRRAIYLDMVRL
ncbi:phage baseplate protein [Massilia horti]|uniref:Phage baseplate protein n=1 Tax=Massilia horti TaxID=2562153 RepID=A0A4Y9T0D9_9BURK|nr:phage baseplate protein [Massilia horti]TFW32642.1 phage baseplate protein [Massilia horti]